MISDAAVEAVGGAIGSVLSVAITYPLTTVSTWQALDHKDEDKQLAAEQEQAGKKLVQLPSPFKELLMYSQSKGWQALFAGLRPCLAATAVSQGLYFYLYSALRTAVVRHIASGSGGPQHQRAVDGRSADIGVWGSTLVASLAGAVNVLVTNPVWVVAMQMQAMQRHAVKGSQGRGLTAVQVASQLYREAGLAGFWKGLAPALVMVMNPTLQYILYEWLTARLRELRRAAAAAAATVGPGPGPPRGAASGLRLSAGDVFVLTALAKMGATLLTYPLLLVKSRLQAMNQATASDAQYRGVRDAVQRILRTEGFSGFFKGIQVKMIQTVLSAAMLMAIKEQVYLGTRAMMRPVKV